MVSEMVERVSKALIEADPGADERSLPMPTRTYEAMARAAIKAMMEPTEDMAERGASEMCNWNIPNPESGEAVWKAMLTAALKEND